ncbi:hypothetical protein AWW72_15510 [Acinetobacter sp. NRRL B-65365]|uniref:hypothetical protein n=1 Tax=Acinetobacter sp. NRRL B-65365 TaxID=1785092 RepID=UPI00079FE32E|nr:hypothetical protein [Acinetobacter sp. NRRL B-65365]KYQ83155.1 hypothetical protein AWW72_15510 [Acinetobacter sp. NRRL B-65365]
MINEYRNAIRDHINRIVQQGKLSQLIIWDVKSDEATDPTLLSLRIYGTRIHTDVIQVACGVSGIWEKLPEKRIAVPTISDVLRIRNEYQV